MVKQPIYGRIERELRRRLAQLDDGARFPSEPELALEFGVSRMTVRAALANLERDGLLERIPGRGSYARRAPAVRRATRLASFHDQAVAAGKVPRSRVLRAGVRAPTVEESRALGVQGEIVAISRIRYMDDVPMALEDAVFIPGLADLIDIDLERESVYAAIRALGFIPAGGRSVLGARAAGDDAADLNANHDTALVVETRIVTDLNGLPIEYTSSAYMPSRYAIEVDFTIEVQELLGGMNSGP